MKILNGADKTNSAQAAFKQVFKSNNPFNEMFTENISDKLLICPTEGYFLSKMQFESLLKTIIDVGDTVAYVSITETETMFSGDSDNWQMDTSLTYEEYSNAEIYLENAIYSSKGDWGILISHEDHAAVGGNSQFINTFKSHYQSWESDISHFRDLWTYNQKKYKANLGWISGFKMHLGLQ